MNIRNCRNCGRIFNYLAGPILCQVCREEIEKKFTVVKEYIREHPGVGIPEVSAACEVDPQMIRDWLKDERLQVTEDSPIFLQCESCGENIRSGRFCDRCKANMGNGMREILKQNRPQPVQPEKKEKESPRMRFL